MIELRRVSKIVPSGDSTLTILHELDLTVPPGQFAAIVGPSGSGKSTLMGLIAGLDRPTSGEVWVAGTHLGALGEDETALLRRKHIGIVFQSFHLIPTLTALENVQIPLELQEDPEARQRALEYLDRVGLATRGHHYPVQLSGGEQQRVAIARAFASQAAVLLADEPTGNLDTRTGEKVFELILELNRERKTTLVLVTHNADLCRKADRVITLVDGAVTADGPPV